MIYHEKEPTKEIIQRSKDTGTAVLFKNFYKEEDLPTWNDFLQAIDKHSLMNSNENPLMVDMDPRFRITGWVRFWSDFFISTLMIGQTLDIKKFRSFFDDLSGDSFHEAQSNVVLSSSGNWTFHFDETNNFFIQGDGSAEWEVNDEKNILTKGDLIYNPKHNPHKVTGLSARNALIFSYF